MNRRTLLQVMLSTPLVSAAPEPFGQQEQGTGSVPAPIMIGTHYEYPFGGNAWRTPWRPKSPADWKRDLASIRATGFDLIRIRIGFDSKLEDVETLLDLAHELGLKVDYGFATFYAPDWFTQKYPEARVVTSSGEVLGSPRDTQWPRACIEHRPYRELWRALVEGSAKRFKDHPAIILWDIHNEPSNVCYCQVCRKLFKEHIAARYTTVERLNAAWKTSFADFEACTERPRGKATGPDALESHYGAWRMFQAERMTAFLNEGMALIRAHVADKPITYNVAGDLESGADWWNTTNCGLAALSDYWGSDALTTGRSFRMAFLAAINPGKEVWVLETLGGSPPSAWSMPLWTGKHLELETWSFLGQGAKGVIQYRWEPIMSENETLMFCMVDVDSDDTEKRVRMSQVIRQVNGLQDFLGAAVRLEPQVYLYLPRHHYVQASLIHPYGEWLTPNRFPWTTTLEGWYGLLTHAGYTTAFFSGPLEAVNKEHAVVVPFPEFLAETEWAALESVAAKGCLIVLQLPTEDPAFAAQVTSKLALTIDEVEVRKDPVDGWVITREDGKNGGAAYEKRLTLREGNGLDVRARFYDNHRPALFCRDKGQWLVSTFDVGHSYNVTLRKEMRRMIVSWIESKLKPKITVQGIDEDYRPLVEVNALQHEDRVLLICCNRSPYDLDMNVSVQQHASGRLKVPPFESRQAFVSKT